MILFRASERHPAVDELGRCGLGERVADVLADGAAVGADNDTLPRLEM